MSSIGSVASVEIAFVFVFYIVFAPGVLPSSLVCLWVEIVTLVARAAVLPAQCTVIINDWRDSIEPDI